MTRRTPMLAAAAVAALLALSACSSASTPARPAGSSTAAASGSTAPSSPQTHNDADVVFARQMIPHHQQAVHMSDVILAKEGIDPRVSQLATQIKAAQGPEIQTMQTWLRQWGQPPADTGAAMPGHAGMGAMGGMMTESDMQALQSAAGRAASKLFLTQMIEHHRGAVDAAQAEITSGRYGPAIALAHAIVTSQQQEIATMQTIGVSL